MSAMNVLPDKKTFELVARQLGISEAFVEKDWYVTQALSIIAKVNPSDFKLVFFGGTALSKAHDLIQRFSEDIDFIIIAPQGTENRKVRSVLKNKIIQVLHNGGFQIESQQVEARNENRFIAIDLNYETQFSRLNSLRPHIQIEMTVKTTQLPTVGRSVSSFVAQLTNKPAEVELINCMDPIENAADKLSALTWRVLDRNRIDSKDDPALVRHIYDLAILKDIILKRKEFSSLVTICMEQDDGRSKNHPEFSSMSMSEKFNRLLTILEADLEYAKEYDQFVKGMSYSTEEIQPDYEAAVEVIRNIISLVK